MQQDIAAAHSLGRQTGIAIRLEAQQSTIATYKLESQGKALSAALKGSKVL